MGIFRLLAAPICASALAAAPMAMAENQNHEYLATDFLATCQKVLESGHPRAGALNPSAPNPKMEVMNDFMNREVIGQRAGVTALLNAVEVASANMQDPKKPFSRNLFTGPTGVGKTETVIALVKALGGDPDQHLIRIDCGEFQEGHEISRLIGATASYVGYGDKPMLHPDVLKERQLKFPLANGQHRMVNVLLIDEIEKCSDKVFRLLLGILDYGKATMGDNTESFFRDTIFNATSNLGAAEAEALINARIEELRRQDASQLTEEQKDLTGRMNPQMASQFKEGYDNAIVRRFAPEFRNRWKAIIQYMHLGPQEHLQILQKLLARVQQTVFDHAMIKVGVIVDANVRDLLVKEGANVKDGARPMENLLDVKIRMPIARLMVTDQIRDGDIIIGELDPERHEITWRVVAEGLDKTELVQFANSAYRGYGFDKYDWDAGKKDANQKPKEQDLIGALNMRGPKTLKRIYLDSPVDATPMQMKVGENSVGLTVKFAVLGKQLVRLEYHDNGSFRATRMPEIPANLKPKYDGKMKTFEEATVREMMAREEKGESP